MKEEYMALEMKEEKDEVITYEFSCLETICYPLEQVINNILKCLGLYDDSTVQRESSQTQTEYVTEELASNYNGGVIRSRPGKRPMRPPVNAGGGGQTNTASS
ncbi:hypothetical protein Droror1_Dr00022018 [Drosera rotundifolia]